MPKPDPKRSVDESDPDTTKGDDENDGDDSQGSEGERTVPLSVLKTVTRDNQALKAKLAKVEGLVEGLKAGQQKSQAPQPEKVWTRAELRAAVNEGKITEDQMDAQLEKQAEARMEQKATDAATASRGVLQVQAEIDRYTQTHPDLLDEGSDLRAKVQAEFDYLVRLGDNPNSLSTELKAVRAALGPINANKGRKKPPETHEETGGSGADNERGGDGPFKGLTHKEKSHYEKLVNKGIYRGAAGEKALKAELDGIRNRRKAMAH